MCIRFLVTASHLDYTTVHYQLQCVAEVDDARRTNRDGEIGGCNERERESAKLDFVSKTGLPVLLYSLRTQQLR